MIFDEVDSLNSGRNSHQYDAYFASPGRTASHSLPPTLSRPNLQQFRNYREVENVVHEDPLPIEIFEKDQKAKKKVKQKASPNKVSFLQKTINDEL